jgi:hypothetical protein
MKRMPVVDVKVFYLEMPSSGRSDEAAATVQGNLAWRALHIRRCEDSE